ncbi:unnamed protein product [Kuraishia capsulata CBS 1993]|uniref:beta-glucosidase n=1 Tax=Kuraishia capsulata CBS 1993 TaxID=1382522 RepID=W6MQZ8_9ASCO|nr:uncharacterized protein KUCA_T00004763001 [Kuraishia capsulata CBS 1993]CDK28778.1 unnamed protein product [Kuraishia capsulata CBS 1993]
MPEIKKLPKDFLWGYATASYQVEGACEQDGRELSIWDTFSRDPTHTEDGKSGDVATDSYNRWEEDIALMKSYGVNAYRFSLSWSRIIPKGGRDDPVNPEGIAFYRNFILKLLENGIKPMPTIFHWDTPQALQDKYLGFLNKDEIVQDFVRYADVCFENFGDLVETWLTINEPNIYSILGHCIGAHAPGRSSDRTKSPEGNSLTEPYIVGHSLLVCHARTINLWRTKYKQKYPHVKLGIVINVNWGEPYDSSEGSKEAAEEFMHKASLWLSDPVYFGDYSDYLKSKVGDRLPVFTEEEKSLLKGSNDFFGLNHYTAYYIKKRTTPIGPTDFMAQLMPDIEPTQIGSDGKEIGPKAGLSWVRPVAWGFRKLLEYLYDRYHQDIYITENGVICPNERNLPREVGLKDQFRIDYFKDYANQIIDLVNEGRVPVKSYIIWSFLDNFEWQEGFTRFGVTWVDFDDKLTRYPKDSAGYIKKFFEDHLEK